MWSAGVDWTRQVGPVDNRPYTHLLRYFVKKRKKITEKTTCDMWHVTHDMWRVVRDEHSFKISAPYILRFGIDCVLKNFPQRMSLLLIVKLDGVSPGDNRPKHTLKGKKEVKI